MLHSISERGYVVVATDKYKRNGWLLSKDSTNEVLVQLYEADFGGEQEVSSRIATCPQYDSSIKTYGFSVKGYDYPFEVNVNV